VTTPGWLLAAGIPNPLLPRTPLSRLASMCCSSTVSNKSPLGVLKTIEGEARRELVMGESYKCPISTHIPIPVKSNYQRIRLPSVARRCDTDQLKSSVARFGYTSPGVRRYGKSKSTSLLLPTVTSGLARRTPTQSQPCASLLSEHAGVPMNYWDMANTICLASPPRGQKYGARAFLMLKRVFFPKRQDSKENRYPTHSQPCSVPSQSLLMLSARTHPARPYLTDVR
jgi:hypothetical protein